MRAALILISAALCAGPAWAQFELPDGEGDGVESGVRPLVRYPPAYPLRGAMLGAQAMCTMTFEISDAGKPLNICGACNTDGLLYGGIELVLEFLEAAKAAVVTWEYTPDGSGNRYQTVIDFSLQGGVPSNITPPDAPTCTATPAIS